MVEMQLSNNIRHIIDNANDSSVRIFFFSTQRLEASVSYRTVTPRAGSASLVLKNILTEEVMADMEI